jgi:putative restriction endonuclease
MDALREVAVRETMFGHLDGLLAMSDDECLLRDATADFMFFGERIAMRQLFGRGIHKPQGLSAALSITTTYRAPGAKKPYDDSIGEEGLPRYKYEGTDPDFWTNRALRLSMEAELPLAYFIGVRPDAFLPVYPVFVIGEDPINHEFTLGFSRADFGIDTASLTAPERVYYARLTKQRLHQPRFRQQILIAYRSSCAVCHLRHERLLDAAHIIGDSQPGGDPVVQNGLALCKIHHAAFDANFLGVRPDYRVEINQALMEEVDGPMLKHGLQEMHGLSITVPRSRSSRPDPARLEVKYEEFRRAS